MANLKVDLINKVSNEKYFSELELVRLAQEPNMNYKDKIEEMSLILGDIALLNAQLGMVEQYFKEPAEGDANQVPQGQQQAPTQQPQVVHQGQTHGE